MYSTTFALAVALIALAWIVGSTFMIVRQKRVRLIEGFGKFKTAKYAGIGIKKPYPFHYIAGELSLRVQSLEEKVSIKTKDNVFLYLPVIVQYSVSDPEKAFYEAQFYVGVDTA